MQSTLKVLSVLLAYPEQAVLDHADEMIEALRAERALPEPQRVAVERLIDELRGWDLLDLQAEYGDLFDRGRSLALYLYEHSHGDARDRGPAMLALKNLYEANGFELATAELPDHIPVFLEFLSQAPPAEARGLLAQAAPVFARLGARLDERESRYAAVFKALIALSGSDVRAADLHEEVAEEARDDTFEALDAAWAEPEVRFGPDAFNEGGEQTIQWVPRNGGRDQAGRSQGPNSGQAG